MTTTTRPAPVPDAASRPFWEGAANGKLRLPACARCQTLFYPPPPRCPHCQNDTLTWTTLSGRVRLRGWTTLTVNALPGREGPVTVVECAPVESPDTVLVVLDDRGVTRNARPDGPARLVFRADANGWHYPELAEEDRP